MNLTQSYSTTVKKNYNSGTILKNDPALENHLTLRLQEQEELNSHLKSLVEQKTRELDEITVTNTKFISILAHDLRGPFSSILGVLGLLKENLNDYDVNEIKKFLDIATISASNTLSLLESLLTWTISQNQEKSFNPVKINLYELLSFEIENFQVTSEQKQIKLYHTVGSDLNLIADLQMIKTILRNLISNAVKYSFIGGEIIISALKNHPFVEITVKDNGIGIANYEQKNLFKLKEFHSKAGTNKEKGTGLGLLLCKEFVELHGGYIRLESKPGKGTSFKFTLPHWT